MLAFDPRGLNSLPLSTPQTTSGFPFLYSSPPLDVRQLEIPATTTKNPGEDSSNRA